MDRARLFLKRGLLALGLLIIPALLFAQGPYSAQIQQALQAFVQQAHTWTATQTFSGIVVNGSCTGCGGGGAPTDATYITQTANSSLSAEQALSLNTTGLMKSTTGTGVVSTALVGDVTGLFTGTCTGTATAVLGSNGVVQCVNAFPYANQRGTFLGLGLNNSNSAGATYMPASDSFALTNACIGAASSYWLHPIGGFLRNVTATTSGTNGNAVIKVNVNPGCVSSGAIVPNGGATVLPGATAGGVVDSWAANQAEWWHLNQWLPLGFSFARAGASTAAIISSFGAEFVADNGLTGTVLGFSQSIALTASSTQYLGFGSFLNNTELNIAIPIPVAGTIRNLTFSHTTAPANDVVVSVMKNGTPTTITKTIVAADVAGNYIDNTHTVSIAAGDYVSVQTVSGASTQPLMQAATLLFEPTDLTSAFLYGSFNAGTVTTTNKYALAFSPLTGTTLASMEYTFPMACTVSDLYVTQATANGGSTVTTLTVMKNGVATAVTGTVGVGVTGSVAVDTTHSVAFVAGDRFTLQYITNSGTSGTMGGWGVRCN